jgi:S-(hydroxymethyl)glutathione dehydrogenase/alcohol dehydrogenase
VITELTDGRMCNVVVMTMGVGDGSLIADAMAITGKAGAVVVTNAHPQQETTVTLSLADLTIMEKRLLGSCFGSANARSDIPMLIELYRRGQLELDRLITRTYSLEAVNEGYADLHAGKNIRGVLVM